MDRVLLFLSSGAQCVPYKAFSNTDGGKLCFSVVRRIMQLHVGT